MHTFKFSGQDVLRLIIEAEEAEADNHRATYGKEGVPALHFVNDEGVYLMSSRRDPIGSVVYAKGHGPDTHLGGDDFVEQFPLSELGDVKGVLREHKNATFALELSDTSIGMTIIA